MVLLHGELEVGGGGVEAGCEAGVLGEPVLGTDWSTPGQTLNN